ncbi:MAG: aquaporin family protein, partial [Acidimicrobiales bacterium]
LLANAMFAVRVAWSTKARATGPHELAEVVATAGLVLIAMGAARAGAAARTAAMVGAYIGAAYFFTSSTSFANPAITVGRMFSNTFSGIAPASAPRFVLAQLGGLVVGVALVRALYPPTRAA